MLLLSVPREPLFSTLQIFYHASVILILSRALPCQHPRVCSQMGKMLVQTPVLQIYLDLDVAFFSISTWL